MLNFYFYFFSPGAGIELSSLLVVEGKICWALYIDGLVVSSDGNLLDALGAAIKVVGCSNYQIFTCAPLVISIIVIIQIIRRVLEMSRLSE